MYAEKQRYDGWYNNLAHPTWGSIGKYTFWLRLVYHPTLKSYKNNPAYSKTIIRFMIYRKSIN